MFGKCRGTSISCNVIACCAVLLCGARAQDDGDDDFVQNLESVFCFPRNDGSCCAVATDREGGVSHISPDVSEETLSLLSSGPGIIGELSRGNPISSWPVFVATSPDAHSEDCRWHSLKFVDALSKLEFWALQMYDSSAKLPPGLLSGNVNQLGDFDECLGVSSDKVKGQYCLALLDVSAGPGAGEDLVRAVSAVRGGGFLHSSHHDPGHFVPRFSTVQWALCVPDACRPRDVEVGVARALRRLNGSSALRVDVRVEPDMCYKQERTPWGPAAVGVIISFCAVVTLVLIATFRDSGSNHLPADKGRLERAALSFSLRRTVPELLSPADGDVRCVHGLRALAMAALYLAHRVIVVMNTPFVNRTAFTEVAAQPWTMVFRASIVYTDSFLFLSGLLAAYSLSKELARKGRVDWRKRLLARYIRLTPAMMCLLLFNAYVWEHLGYGPMWNKLVTRNSDLCKEFLWRNMLYLQNAFPFQEMCGPHTHQLALDMQLFLISPLLVQLLLTRRWLGVGVFAALNVSSAALRYWSTSQHRLSIIIHHGQTVEQLYKTADNLYSISAHRATPYLFGIALGCILHNTGKKVHIPKVVAAVGWGAAAYGAHLSLWSMSGAASPLYRYDAEEAAAYAALSPVAWALALGWVVLACHTGRGGLMNSFLTWRVLAPISRLSYSIYLTQFTLFFYNAGTIRTAKEFHILESINAWEVLAVLVVSVAVALLFDLPLQEVKSILMEKGSVKRQLTKTNSNNNIK